VHSLECFLVAFLVEWYTGYLTVINSFSEVDHCMIFVLILLDLIDPLPA